MARRITGPDAGTRLGVVQRANWKCERCGTLVPQSISVHHRTPRGMGGTRDQNINAPSNLVLLCGSGTTGCHGWIESHREAARELGWLVPRGFNSTEIPIIENTGRAWLLDDDFNKIPTDTSP